jgi:hypothetical protein
MMGADAEDQELGDGGSVGLEIVHSLEPLQVGKRDFDRQRYGPLYAKRHDLPSCRSGFYPEKNEQERLAIF